MKTTGTTMDEGDADAPTSSYIITSTGGRAGGPTLARPLFLSPPGTIETVACSVQTMSIETADVGVQCQRGKVWNQKR